MESSTLRLLAIALVLVGGLFAPGCGGDDEAAATPKKEVSESNETDEHTDTGEDDAKGEDEDRTLDPTAGQSGTPTEREEPEEPEPEVPGPTEPQLQNTQCSSSKDGHTSLTKFSYKIGAGEKVEIVKFTVLVNNKDGRNENDVDVYVGDKKAFNSGDILKNGKETSVPWKGNELKAGAKIKISTNFDTSFTDPWAACTITL